MPLRARCLGISEPASWCVSSRPGDLRLLMTRQTPSDPILSLDATVVEGSTGITHQERLEPFPHRLEPEIVVDAPVGQQQTLAEGDVIVECLLREPSRRSMGRA